MSYVRSYGRGRGAPIEQSKEAGKQDGQARNPGSVGRQDGQARKPGSVGRGDGQTRNSGNLSAGRSNC